MKGESEKPACNTIFARVTLTWPEFVNQKFQKLSYGLKQYITRKLHKVIKNITQNVLRLGSKFHTFSAGKEFLKMVKVLQSSAHQF